MTETADETVLRHRRIDNVLAPLQGIIVGSAVGLGVKELLHWDRPYAGAAAILVGVFSARLIFEHLEKKKNPLGLTREDAQYKTTTYLLGSAAGLGAAALMAMVPPLPQEATSILAVSSAGGFITAVGQKIKHKLKF